MPKHDIGFELTQSEVTLLEQIERRSCHEWQRSHGNILVKSLGKKCIGPTCAKCGFQFCLLCDWPKEFAECRQEQAEKTEDRTDNRSSRPRSKTPLPQYSSCTVGL